MLRALFFSLMVVQTLRMKIQESPVTCDLGRVSSGEVRGSDPDCEKTGCEDVPRLDLTALTEDNNWGGERLEAILMLLFFLLSCFEFLLTCSTSSLNRSDLSGAHTFLYKHTHAQTIHSLSSTQLCTWVFG